MALAALALVAVVSFELFAGAARGARAVDFHQRALLIAEARLAEAALGEPLAPGEMAGTSDGIAWTRTIRRHDSGVAPGAAPLLQLFEIDVTARWPGGRIELARLAAAPIAR